MSQDHPDTTAAELHAAIEAACTTVARQIDELPPDAPLEVVVDTCFHPLLELRDLARRIAP